MAKKKAVVKKKQKVSGKKNASTSKRGLELDRRRKALEALEKKLAKVDEDLAEIERGLMEAGLQKSVVVDEDLAERKKMLAMEVSHADDSAGGKTFYRNFVLRCGACKRQFENELRLKPVVRVIYCPSCGKDHAVGIHPSTRIHNLILPKSLKFVRHE